MFKKTIAVFVAALLAGALLPSLAFAAPTGGASLAVGANVFPGSAQAFSIKVDNTAVAVVGESINWVSVILPHNQGITTTSGVAAPSGWTASTTSTSMVQRYVFRADGSGIAPLGSLQFPFPANVAAPSADRAGQFRVFASSDGGATTTNLDGALTATIRTLELQTFGITAPAGAADGSATSGQSVTFTAKVKNYASGAQTVTAATTGGSEAASVPAGTVRDLAIPVTLQQATGNVTFKGTATAAGSEAISRNAVVAIQAGPVLTLVSQSFSPTRVRSNAPINYAFSVGATKANTPNLTVNNCTLNIDANGTPNVFSLASPTAWTANNQQTLTFAAGTVSGLTGSYSGTVSCAGTDGNDHPFSQSPLNGTVTLNIDNLGPVITDVTVALPSGQTAFKNGDTANVTWKIDDTGSILKVTELRDNLGTAIPLTNVSRSGNNYSGRATVNFPVAEGTLYAQIEAIDFEGGNPGGASSAIRVLDNVVPQVFDPARTTSTNTIEVFLDDNSALQGGCDAGHWMVENNVVTSVQGFDANETCGTSNYRVLVLASHIDIDATPAVTYNRQTGITPVRDGAANQALTRTVDTVVGILPAAPQLVEVNRNTASGDPAKYETAVFDNNTYFTRFAGNDMLVTFTGAKAGYQAFVVDGQGRDVAGPFALGGGNDTITVPIGTSQTVYQRGIQMVNAAGRGDILFLDIALDQTAPRVANATGEGQKVTVNFNDVVWAGNNFAADWFGYETSTDGLNAYQPARVDIVEGNLSNRVLTFQFDNPAQFANLVDYLNSGSIRYEDRAGNTLADTLS